MGNNTPYSPFYLSTLERKIDLDIKRLLIDGKAKVGIWGCGYIGFTSMVNFAQNGIGVIGYDIDSKVVDSINNGIPHIPNLNYWIGYPLDSLYKVLQATNGYQYMLVDDIRVHLIAIPTEKNGEPYSEPLVDVITKISYRKTDVDNPVLIMIESTLTPGMFEDIVLKILCDNGKVIGKDVLVGIAPRRDWFESPDKNLKTLNRVIGGTDINTTNQMKEVLGIICDKLIPIPDTRVVEMVKSVENSILHVCVTYANQLAWAYPDVDVVQVLRLASTHWRIPLYYPSVGTGGYCIPLSSKYIRQGASIPKHLTITNQTIEADYFQPFKIAKVMSEKTKGGSIGVLGLSYKQDLKVHILSPVLRIIDWLKTNNIVVKVYDPYYTKEEIKRIVDTDTFLFPQDLIQFKGIIIVPPHRLFRQISKPALFKYLIKGQVILDNEGAWSKYKDDFVTNGIDYHRVGDGGWCL